MNNTPNFESSNPENGYEEVDNRTEIVKELESYDVHNLTPENINRITGVVQDFEPEESSDKITEIIGNGVFANILCNIGKLDSRMKEAISMPYDNPEVYKMFEDIKNAVDYYYGEEENV